MGDRASIMFVNGKDESIVLCHHWGGTEFHGEANIYLAELVADLKKDSKDGKISEGQPLGRLEPNTVMVDFCRWYFERNYYEQRIMSSLYFGKTLDDVDDRDNGCNVIDLQSEYVKALQK